MKVSIKNYLGLAALFMAGVACADVQNDVKALQAKVQQAQEVIKQQIEVAKQDQQRASLREKMKAKEIGLMGALQSLNELAAEFKMVLADGRYQAQDQLKSTLKDEIVVWLNQEIIRLDSHKHIPKDGALMPDSIGFNEGITFVNNYLKEFLAELKSIVQ